MSERRAATKGRRLGSSRRKQLREGSGEAPAPAPAPSEEPPWASEIVQRVQQFLSDRDTEQAGVITRSDVQKLQEEGFPCSREELELVFDGLDAAGTGRLGTEEFLAGLRQFLSSHKAAREHRRRKTASRRVRLVLPTPALEAGDSEERRHFAAFMEQLGTDNVSEEQEIWQLWVKLRQDEPQLLDNLEDFLAKMRHRIQEARSEKEALELTLNKRVAEHDKDVQQLCEVLEQQIQQEQLRLQQQSMARSHQHGEELRRVLDASEREVQRLVTAQMELERRCRSLHSSQQATSTENRQLEESNRALEHHLQHLHQQLQQTQDHLRTMRATVVWEHTGQPGDRVVAELPIEVPMSPQLSPGKSEKFRSEMRIRLGSQSDESKAKSTHKVVWEMLPAEINLSGAPGKASSAEEDPFPESLKEEAFSDQSSLLREMNDAIAALSKHLKAQAPGAPPALADAPCHPWDNIEPQMGPEAATAHGTTPGVLQETLPGHSHHELLEGDLQEGPATAELRAPDVTQAGASTGAGHCMAQEPGAEQGENPEEAQKMLFLQGKGAGVEMVLNVAEHLGESTKAGEQVPMEVEGAGWLQEKTGGKKPQLLGEAEEVEISQGENLEAGLGPPEAGQEGVAVGQCLAVDELQPGGTLGQCVQAPSMALQEWADPASGLPEKLETELGEHLEPEPPSWSEAQVEAAHGDGVPEVAVAPGPAVLDEERASPEVQPQGETADSEVLEVLPARAERAGSSRAGSEEEEVEEADPREAEQLQGECARGGAGQGGSVGAQEPLAAAVLPTHSQEGGVGTDVKLMEAQSSTSMELLAEVEADLQVSNEAGSPGVQQGAGVDPGVPLEDKPELGLGEEMGAAAVHREGPSPEQTPVGSPDLCGLFPVKSQALELVEADLKLCGGLSPKTPQGGEGGRATDLQENEEEDGAQEQGECGLPHEPEPHPSGVTLGQGEGAGAGLQPGEEAESLGSVEHQSSGANVQLTAEGDELRLTLGGSTEADLQLLGEVGSSETEQGGRLDPDEQPLDQEDKAELVEVEAEDAQADLHLSEGLSSGVPQGGEIGTNVRIEEEEDGAQGQGEDGLPHEPVLDLQGSGAEHSEGADENMQAQEEAESLDTTEDQSRGANVQLIAEGDELKSASGESTEADLQHLAEAGSPGTEQGGRLNPDEQPLDQEDKAGLVEVEAEDAQADLQLCGGPSSGAPWGGEGGGAVQIEEDEEEDVAQAQGEHGLPHEPEPHPSGVTLGQGEGAGAGLQPGEEAESLGSVEHQSSGANVQLTAEGDELRLTLGGSTEADLQLLGEVGSPGTEQGGRLDPDEQPLDQVDKAELVEVEAEDAQADLHLSEGLSSGVPQGGEIGTNVRIEEEEDGAQGKGEGELPHEPVLDLQGSGVEHSEGADENMQAQEEAESLDTTEDQSHGANVQLIAEGDELKSASGESTEAHWQALKQTDSLGTEQGGSVDPDVQPLDQVDKAELVEVEAEDSCTDTQLCGGLSPEIPQGEGDRAAVQLRDGAADWGQGQSGRELVQELVPHPSGVTMRQRRGTDAGVQPVEEVVILPTVGDQSSGANVQLVAEEDELRLTLGGRTEADLQLLGEAGSPGTEQGGRLDPDEQPLDQEDKAGLVEVEAEDAQADLQLCGGPSSGAPWGGEGGGAVQIEEDEEEDVAQAQGEHGLPHEPEPHPSGVTLGQGEGAGAGLQPGEEAESLGSVEHQSSGANVQLVAEGDELRLTLGGSTEADLQLLGEAGSPGTEQGGRLDPDEQPLDQVDKAELVEVEAEDAQADLHLSEGLSSGVPQGGEIGTNVRIEEEEDGAQGKGEGELPHEPVLDLQGSGVEHSEGADENMQAQEEAESLDTTEDQSHGANVQLIAEGDELKSASGESTEAHWQALKQTDSLGTEQGGRLDPDVQPLDQVDKAELVEVEAGDAQADLQLCGGLSSGVPRGGEIGANVRIEEEEDGAQGQGEDGLPHEPVLDLQGSGVEHSEGAGENMQAQEEAESLDTTEDQSHGANVQLIAEGDELKSASGESTEADLQHLAEAGSPGTEQGGRLNPDEQPLDQEDKAGLVEVEAEDAQADLQLCGGPSSGAPWGGEGGGAVQIEEDEEEDVAQEQGEHGLPHEPEPHPSGVTLGQGEGAGAGLQPGEEAESLGSVEHQSSGANVQLVAEGDELRLTLGGSTEADLQLLGEVGSSETEQGGSVDPDVQPLDQADREDVLETEVEDAQSDLQLCGGLSSGVPRGGESRTAVQIEEDEEEDGAQGQGEDGLPHEPVLDLQGSGVEHSEGADENMQAQEEAESLDTTEDQSRGANVQLIAEGDELKSASGESTEAHWQALKQTDSLGTEQGGSVDPDVQPLDQVDKAELVEVEAEDSCTDTQLCGGLSRESPQGEGDRAAVQLRDGAADWGQGQSGRELVQELVPHPSGVTMRQRRGTDAGVQPVEEVVILPTVGDQSSGANVQLVAEEDELRLTLGGRTEADLQLLGEAGSPGTEQGGRLDPDEQPLDQEDKAELVEVEAEDAQADLQLCGGPSSGAPWGGEGGGAVQIEEDEEEDVAQEQGEHGLPHEPEPHPSEVTLGQGEGAGAGLQPGEEAESLGSVEHQSSGANVQLTAEAQVQREHGLPQESALDPAGERGKQGGGAGAGVQPQEEAESLDTLEAQSTGADVQLFTEQHESKAGSGGSTQADLTPLSVVGMWEGEQSWTPGLEAGLGASPTANLQEGAAAAYVPPPTEAALCPEPVTAAEGPGLQAKPGTYVGPEGQILESQELLQGERAPAEEKPLDGAHGLEVAQEERLEAGARNVVKTQGLGLNQGHDDAVPALASLFSEVPLQINTLKLETMMQEDVLIPDVWRLCAPGQATPRELQEQVSAQGHEGRLHTVAPRPEGETAPAMEPEHRAARPAEPPKQEVSPASTLHVTVPPEDAGSDQLGMVLRDNSLGQGQLLGEQSKDLSVGQQEKMQEFGQKVSQEGEPSLGAVTAGGAGGPRGCPKAPLDPDHLYNVLFVGDSHVGKTSFLYRLHADTFNPHLAATVGLDYQIKNLVVDNKRFALRLWDSAGQERYHSMTKQFFRKADGVVLMYDITSEYSFSDVRYWLSCIQEAAEDGVAVLLLGNKTDCAAQRQVPTKEGECLAKEHQLMFYECSAASGHNVFESMVSFVRLLKVREDELKNKAEEVPKAPQKKKGCCW